MSSIRFLQRIEQPGGVNYRFGKMLIDDKELVETADRFMQSPKRETNDRDPGYLGALCGLIQWSVDSKTRAVCIMIAAESRCIHAEVRGPLLTLEGRRFIGELNAILVNPDAEQLLRAIAEEAKLLVTARGKV